MTRHLRISPAAASFAAGLLAVAGCDRISGMLPDGAEAVDAESASDGGGPSAAGADEPRVAEIPVVDRFANGGGAIADVAFWSHPTLAFASLVIAGGEAGLTSFVVESGAVASRLPDRTDALDVIYVGGGGYALTLDAVAGRLAGVAIDDATQALSVNAEILDPVLAGATSLCAAAAIADPATAAGFATTPSGIIAISVAHEDGHLSLGATPIPGTAGAVDCVVDPATSDAYFIDTAGVIRVGVGGEIVARAPGGRRIGLILKGPPTDEFASGDADEGEFVGEALSVDARSAEGPILAVAGEDGVISFHDLKGGGALGAIALAASFDHPAVDAATALGAGFGNYGAVYRDGAVAVGEMSPEDGTGGVSLVPWNAVADRLAIAVGAPIDVRNLQPADDGAFRIEIEAVAP